MLLFVVALDLVVRFLLASCLQEDGVGRAYADDLGFALSDLPLALPALDKTLRAIVAATLLDVKLRKCCVVLAVLDGLGRLRAWLEAHLPSWPEVIVPLRMT